MAVPLTDIDDSPLPAGSSDAEYDIYKAALEWQLTTPIVIRSGEDIQSRDRWADRVQPFHHQVRNLITFCRLVPSVLIADEVGLGKTISAGLILSELIARRRVSRALVVCPRSLCDQWVRELDEKFRINAVTVTGAQVLDASNDTSSSVVVTTYETASRYLDDVDFPTDSFQMLIMDEAHRLRNLYGTRSAPRIAKVIQETLSARWFTYVLMLTATPIQNRFTDMYSLIDLLIKARGNCNPFGDWSDFRNQYLKKGSDGRRLQNHMMTPFRNVLNKYVVRTRRVDAVLPFPSRQVETIRVPLTEEEQGFDTIVGEIVGELNGLTQSSLGEALMSSPAALAAQLENMAQKRSRFSNAAKKARAVADSETPPAKLQRLWTLCKELRANRVDWRVVVFTRRIETQKMIQRELEARGVSVGLIGGGRPKENQRDIADFLADQPRIHVLVSTDAGAEGINLQGANWLVNYDLPWNPMVLEQRIGRIQRLGSPHNEVFIQNLVAANTVEERVVARLMQRLMMVTETIGDLESILVTADGGSEDESGKRFEARVREMVVRSLQGQDETKAAEQLAESVELARQEYDDNCRKMNEDLGALDGNGDPVPDPPKFDRKPPSMSAEKFVLQALAAEGRVLREVEQGLWEDVRGTRMGAKIALTPQAAEMSNSHGRVTAFYPGQRAFERLVERWTGRSSHRIMDHSRATDSAAEKLARDWCAGYPDMTFLSCAIRIRKRHINGRVLVRASAENRLDQHERLIEQFVSPEGHKPLKSEATDAPILQTPVSLAEIAPRVSQRVRDHVASDEELVEFCKYYSDRRINELSRTGSDPHLRQRVEDDFTLTADARVVGFRGVAYEEVIMDVYYQVSGSDYTSTLQAVPLLGQIREQPTEETCPITGLTMPYGVLGECHRSGRLIPEHLLFRSNLSGRQAAQEFLVQCELTNQWVLDDEVEVCAISGTRAVTSEFVTCAISNDRILREESALSAISGAIARRDLLRPSELPPHRLGLENERVCCEASGRVLLIDEVGVSAVSQKTVGLDVLVASEKSGRLGLVDETERCEHSGCLLLQDEIGVCSVSHKRVDSSLLIRSEVSDHLALPEYFGRCAVTDRTALLTELEKCQLTETLVLPELLETCAVTGQRMIRKGMVICQVSNVWLSPDIAARSELSDRTVHPEIIQCSDRPPHRKGLPDEMVVCEISGNTLLKDEVGRSVVSGRRIDRELLIGSGDRLAHPSEMVTCEESGELYLPDEVGVCVVSGKKVALELLVQSEVSDRYLLPKLAERCWFTDSLVAPDELETCELSGKRAISQQLATCSETGVRALRSCLVQCADTGEWVVPEMAGRSDYRPRWVVKRLLKQSERPPGRCGTLEEFGVCAVSKKALLLDELESSAVSGLLVDKERMLPSEKSGRLALPDELVRCAESGGIYLPEETAVCEITGDRVAVDFLEESQLSGKVCLKRLFITCPVTQKRVPETETETCAITGIKVASGALVACASTGTRVLPGQLKKCAESGDWVLPSEIAYSDYRSRPVKRSLLRQSATGRLGTEKEFGRCEVSRKELLLDELEHCSVSNKLVNVDLLVTCDLTGERVLKNETYRCVWGGMRVKKSNVGVCELTRARVLKRFLDDNRMLRPLAEILDGHPIPGVKSREDLIPILKSIDPKLFADVLYVCAIEAPSRNKLAVCVTFRERGWFKSRTRYAGLLLTSGPKQRVIGDIVVGERVDQEWELTRTVRLKQ